MPDTAIAALWAEARVRVAARELKPQTAIRLDGEMWLVTEVRTWRERTGLVLDGALTVFVDADQLIAVEDVLLIA